VKALIKHCALKEENNSFSNLKLQTRTRSGLFQTQNLACKVEKKIRERHTRYKSKKQELVSHRLFVV